MAVAALSLAREGQQGHLGRGRQHCELGAGGGEGGWGRPCRDRGRNQGGAPGGAGRLAGEEGEPAPGGALQIVHIFSVS